MALYSDEEEIVDVTVPETTNNKPKKYDVVSKQKKEKKHTIFKKIREKIPGFRDLLHYAGHVAALVGTTIWLNHSMGVPNLGPVLSMLAVAAIGAAATPTKLRKFSVLKITKGSGAYGAVDFLVSGLLAAELAATGFLVPQVAVASTMLGLATNIISSIALRNKKIVNLEEGKCK